MEPMDPKGDDERLARMRGDELANLERITASLASIADDLEAGEAVGSAEIRKTVLEISQTQRVVLEQRKNLGNILGDQNGAGAELDLGAARREINSRLDRLRGTLDSG